MRRYLVPAWRPTILASTVSRPHAAKRAQFNRTAAGHSTTGEKSSISRLQATSKDTGAIAVAVLTVMAMPPHLGSLGQATGLTVVLGDGRTAQALGLSGYPGICRLSNAKPSASPAG